MWICAPQTPNAIVTVVNWAKNNGYQVRPRGKMRNWSPLIAAKGATCPSVLLVDTTQYLTAASVNTATTPKTVTAQTGITIDALLALLEQSNLGLTATPALGDVTLGGVLAVGGHGTAVRAGNETALPGKTYGSIGNLVLSLTAVVWDAANNQYALRTFQRSDPACAALLNHLGRAFITEVKLQVGANQRLRCQTWVNIPATELYAAPGSAGRTYASYIQSTGRITAIWFPFTTNPWVKIWTLAPNQPLLSRAVSAPYNESFTSITPDLATMAAQIIAGNGALTPSFGQLQYTTVASGVSLTFAYDLWGWSKNLLSYVKPDTLGITTSSYAVLTSRANIQRVVNEFTTRYKAQLLAYQALNRYPVNGPLEIRVTGLDKPTEVPVSGATAAQLSPIRPRPDHPEWDVAVWIDIVTIPGTPYAQQFFRETEQWMYSNFSGSYATVRPEWSKGWAFTNSAGWSDAAMLATTIPNAFRAGQTVGDNWDTARATLNQLDPHRVYTSPLLNTLLP
jgi:FAD/FMN-containing dehydrogenase